MNAPRYEPLVKLASGGMATVWIGAARGALGFRQLVAIKRPHPQLLEQPGARQELVEEARLASMIRHANVVDVRDVEEDGDTISLVMDFIEGASLGELLVLGPIPPRVVVRIVRDACAGLHAAHELVDERGRAVGLIHRDISPQNILVGDDGIARVTDFGVAKFARKDGSKSTTGQGTLKGKLAYMAPEYLRSEPIDRRADVFGLGVVLWEALVGKRCFRGATEADTYVNVLERRPAPVSTHDAALAPLDAIVGCALEKDAKARFQNAAAMGVALEDAATEAGLMGTSAEVAAALRKLAGEAMATRRAAVQAKLAHEPSLASLGLSPQPSPVVDTLPLAPPLLPAPQQSGTTLPLTHTPRRAPPITAAAYEVPTPSPSKRRALPFVLGGAALAAALAAFIGAAAGRSVSRDSARDSAEPASSPPPAAVVPSDSAEPTASHSAEPAAPATSAAPPVPSPRPHPQIAAKSALPKASAAPPAPSLKHPAANPYE